MWPNPQFPADRVTFTEKIFNGKVHFLCSSWKIKRNYFKLKVTWRIIKKRATFKTNKIQCYLSLKHHQKIPITIETHFLNHLSNKTVFRYTVEDYEKALKKSGYISRYNVTVFSTEKTSNLAIITNHNKMILNNSEI